MQFGIVHQPLIATVQANRRRPDQVVAFIGAQLCFFERNSYQPRAGDTAEVMITRPQFGTYPEGHQYAGRTDWGKLTALMIEVVDPLKHMLIAINGFECSGSMCRTTADGIQTDGLRALSSEDVWNTNTPMEMPDGTRRRMMLTPGRSDIYVANNVNVGFNGQTAKPRKPTNIWISRKELIEKHGYAVRVAGMTRVEDLDRAQLVRQPRMAA